MYFAGYNDYELIYLVNEGSERALNVLYQKYYIYIYKVAAKYIPRGDKKNDLIQEGLMLLNQSIKRFNPRFDISFYAYFSIVLKRGFLRLLQNGYYYSKDVVDNDYVLHEPDCLTKSLEVNMLRRYLSSELDINIYDECIVGNLNAKAFSKIYNVDYNEVYKRRKAILLRLKKILTNL